MDFDLNIFSNDVRKQFFRFSELLDLYNKKDGRRQLTFEDIGYVDDIDNFITGCLSSFVLTFTLDGSTINWKILNGRKQFKTLLDFYDNKITVQGQYYKDIGFFKSRIKCLQIETFVINPGADDYESIKKFLSGDT